MKVDWPRFISEAKRVHLRYVVEVVEAFGLCPWAKDTRLKGRINMHVTLVTAADPNVLLAEVEACMRAPETEIGMLICPLLPVTAKQFRHVTADIRGLEERARARGEAQIALADFHPIAAFDVTTPERLVPYLRRAPDPMLQIVRTDVLQRVRRSQDHGTSYVDPSMLGALDQLSAPAPSLAQRVAQANARTLQQLGQDKLEAILRDIHEDRNHSYEKLGVALTPASAEEGHTRAYISDTARETTTDSASNRDEKPESKAGYSGASDWSHMYPSPRKQNDI
jgi:hypothetical protein